MPKTHCNFVIVKNGSNLNVIIMYKQIIMDKQIRKYSYNAIPLSNKKE